MWGIEDTDGFLRRLLYVTMTTDPNGRFKRRWVSQQRAVIEEAALDLRMNTDVREKMFLKWSIVWKNLSYMVASNTFDKSLWIANIHTRLKAMNRL